MSRGETNKAKAFAMEEMMMMINTTSPPENPRKCASLPSVSNINSISPTWKLYENPFYITQQSVMELGGVIGVQSSPDGQSNMRQLEKFEGQDILSKKHIHHLQLPVSAKKIAASFFDLTFIKPLMVSELENCRFQILNLKAELEYERKERKKMDAVNKKLARELSEERKNREAYESLCEKLAEEISANKAKIEMLKKEIQEERKMLRVAEVLREERVQMKLSEAKHFLEEKLTELHEMSISKNQENMIQDENVERISTPSSSSGEGRRSSLTEKSTMSNESSGSIQSNVMQRRIISDAANPHIRRGIKGFVEFPKVIRAMGSKNHRHSGNKLECQKAQIRMILKQKSPLKANNVIITS
ncbi:hypothetical protein LIER_12158 [Lithospermum erythrorhizon]|uniref:Branchless trichome n=1 Tax=Lithospermum erythrorhizon TaxID=34254 RepID=A0AAV3PTN6_LITER